MSRRIFCAILALVSLLVLVRIAYASYVVCGIGLSTADCTSTPVPSSDEWPADVPPTFGLGCTGYPSPGGDGPLSPTAIPVTVSRERFKIEVGGQELTGGSFVDLHLTCDWPCDVDGGWTSCHPNSRVRYVGPLVPGQKHKVTWTTGQTRDGAPPWCEFTVSANGVVDAAVFPEAAPSVDGVGWSDPGQSVDAVGFSDGDLSIDLASWADAGPSVDSAVWSDGGRTAETPIGIDAFADLVSAADAVGTSDRPSSSVEDSAAVADGTRGSMVSSSGCSCSVGAHGNRSLGALLLLALTALLARRRGRTDDDR
jgi:MYXO-CTERM domain-containing protein